MIALTYTTTHNTVMADFMNASIGLLFSGLPIGRVIHQQNAIVAQARNDAVRHFLASDCEWMLSLDADVVASPDAVRALIDAEGDIRAGVYNVNASGQWTPAWYEKGADGFYDPTPADKDKKIDACGMGFVMIHRRVFEDMQTTDPWCWFGHDLVNGQRLGEDFTFFHRLNLPVTGVAGARAAHLKTIPV